MDYLVSTSWLKQHQQCDDLVILDCTNFSRPDDTGGGYRTYSGRPQWEKEHIEGAQFADFSRDMSGKHRAFRNTLPSPEQLALALGALGVGNDKRVVLYDSAQSMWAARLWWMLRWIGFDNAAVLDGGLSNWKADGGATASMATRCQAETLAHKVRSELFVSKEDVLEAIGDASTLIIDALRAEQFNGQTSELGLSGHIPSAVNIPAETLMKTGTGLFLPIDNLSQLFRDSKSRRTIVYCGSGIAAASIAFTMTRLGFRDTAIYMPGLQEWICDQNAPVNNRPDHAPSLRE